MEREEFDRKYTVRLNPQQAETVHAVDGPILLLAVPGSGKTTVLVTRLGKRAAPASPLAEPGGLPDTGSLPPPSAGWAAEWLERCRG